MSPDERFAMARLADGLNFMDLIKALNEINVLDEENADDAGEGCGIGVGVVVCVCGGVYGGRG